MLALEVLDYIHQLTRYLEAQDFTDQVDSIAATPIPKPFVDDDEVLLDDLDGGEGLDDLEGLEGLDDLGDEEEDEQSDEVISAMLTLTATAPDYFPRGLVSVSERRDELEPRRAVEGERATAADAEALASALGDLPLVVGRLVSEDRTAAAVATIVPQDNAGRLAAVATIDGWLAQIRRPTACGSTAAACPTSGRRW